MTAPSVMEGLTWVRPGSELVKNLTTKSGMPQYDGSAHGIQGWSFRVLAKHDALISAKEKGGGEQRRKELDGKILESLTGDAHTVMDLGREKVGGKHRWRAEDGRGDQGEHHWQEGH